MICILIGPPGSGKGTLSEILCKEYGFEQFSTGDALREEVKKGTALGKEIDALIRNGNFVPDEMVTELVKNKLHNSNLNILFDGYPRNIEQGKILDSLMQETNRKIDYIIHLNASEEVVVERLGGRLVCPKCAAIYNKKVMKPKVEWICDICNTELTVRDDDTGEAIKKRLKIYHETTKPLLDFYRSRNITIDLDRNKDIDESVNDLLSIIDMKK